MRVLELAAVALLALRALACFAPAGWGVQARLLPTLLAALVLVAHALIEGWRWQMIPVYAVTAVLPLVDGGRLIMQASEVARHPGRGLLGLLGVALLAALPTFLPMPRLPAPNGDAPAIGVLDGQILDASRNDRPIPVRLWFPATNSASGPRAQWLANSDVRLPLLATRAGLPSWFLSHARLLKGSALEGETPDSWAGPGHSWPVALFSHGRAGFKEQNTFLAEALAANGYLVVAMEHAAGAFATTLTDGSLVMFDPALFGDGLPQPEQDDVVRQLGDSWARDASAVLDALAGGEIGSEVGPVNIERVVAVGQSTGGGAMIEFCHRDSRCNGVVGLDPWMLPTSELALTEGLGAPILGLFGDTSFGFFEAINHERFTQLATSTSAQGQAIRDVMIVDANHLDFTDGALLSPWGHLLGQDTGPINAHRAFELISAEVVWFADQVAIPSPTAEPGADPVYPAPPELAEVVPWSPSG